MTINIDGVEEIKNETIGSETVTYNEFTAEIKQ